MQEIHLTIQRAELKDLPRITEIYNSAILHTTATFDTMPKSDDEQLAWYKKHEDPFPVLVAKNGNKVLGWASLSSWSDRCAYAQAAEVSIYLDEAYRGQGVGTRLFGELIETARRLNFHVLISRIGDYNEASFRLHEKYGFWRVGILKEVGFKFNRRLDNHMFQLILEPKRERNTEYATSQENKNP